MPTKSARKDTWNAWLMHPKKVMELRDSGKKLTTMELSDLKPLFITSAIQVVALDAYAAKKEFYKILVAQPWFPKEIPFTKIYRQMYVKNLIDNRLSIVTPEELARVSIKMDKPTVEIK